jgi:hypothetical protein
MINVTMTTPFSFLILCFVFFTYLRIKEEGTVGIKPTLPGYPVQPPFLSYLLTRRS